MKVSIILIALLVGLTVGCKKEDIGASTNNQSQSNKFNAPVYEKIKFCVKHSGNSQCYVTPCSPCDCPLGICLIRTRRYGSGLSVDEIQDGYGTGNAYFDTTYNEVMIVFDQATALPDSTIPVTTNNRVWDQNNDIVQNFGYDSIVFDVGSYPVNFDSLPYGFVILPYVAYK